MTGAGPLAGALFEVNFVQVILGIRCVLIVGNHLYSHRLDGGDAGRLERLG
jgi:hypothetical protein